MLKEFQLKRMKHRFPGQLKEELNWVRLNQETDLDNFA